MVKINKHIDTKPMFLNWEIDVLLVFFGVFYIGVLFTDSFTSLILFVFAGMITSYLYNKFKSTTIKGISKHVIYMLDIKTPKHLIPSSKRNFIGA